MLGARHQRSGEGVVRRNGCPKGCFWRVSARRLLCSFGAPPYVKFPEGPKIEKIQDFSCGLKHSSGQSQIEISMEIENFKRATQQGFFCGPVAIVARDSVACRKCFQTYCYDVRHEPQPLNSPPKLKKLKNRPTVGFGGCLRNRSKIGQKYRKSCIFDLFRGHLPTTYFRPIFELDEFFLRNLGAVARSARHKPIDSMN